VGTPLQQVEEGEEGLVSLLSCFQDYCPFSKTQAHLSPLIKVGKMLKGLISKENAVLYHW